MSLQRAFKTYESQMKIFHIYGDWSWTSHQDYEAVRKSLTATTIANEIKLAPSARKTSAAFMDKNQFKVLHKSTWDAAISSDNH